MKSDSISFWSLQEKRKFLKYNYPSCHAVLFHAICILDSLVTQVLGIQEANKKLVFETDTEPKENSLLSPLTRKLVKVQDTFWI